jgi:hypothetical protein
VKTAIHVANRCSDELRCASAYRHSRHARRYAASLRPSICVPQEITRKRQQNRHLLLAPANEFATLDRLGRYICTDGASPHSHHQWGHRNIQASEFVCASSTCIRYSRLICRIILFRSLRAFIRSTIRSISRTQIAANSSQRLSLNLAVASTIDAGSPPPTTYDGLDGSLTTLRGRRALMTAPAGPWSECHAGSTPAWCRQTACHLRLRWPPPALSRPIQRRCTPASDRFWP